MPCVTYTFVVVFQKKSQFLKVIVLCRERTYARKILNGDTCSDRVGKRSNVRPKDKTTK